MRAVRNERDPLRQAKRAGELITLYQQRGIELARLRRDAMNWAAQERGISFNAIAAELGLARGRITRLRQTAPPSALGSVGAAHYVTGTLAALYKQVGGNRFSMVLRSEHTQDGVAASELVYAPRVHD